MMHLGKVQQAKVFCNNNIIIDDDEEEEDDDEDDDDDDYCDHDDDDINNNRTNVNSYDQKKNKNPFICSRLHSYKTDSLTNIHVHLIRNFSKQYVGVTEGK